MPYQAYPIVDFTAGLELHRQPMASLLPQVTKISLTNLVSACWSMIMVSGPIE